MHFELTAGDPARLATFYGQVFGWQFQKWDGPMEYWLIRTGQDGEPGINGGLGPRQEGASGTVNTIGVPSVDDAIAAITSAGGSVAVPKMPIPGMGVLAYCTDPEGTMFGVMEATS